MTCSSRSESAQRLDDATLFSRSWHAQSGHSTGSQSTRQDIRWQMEDYFDIRHFYNVLAHHWILHAEDNLHHQTKTSDTIDILKRRMEIGYDDSDVYMDGDGNYSDSLSTGNPGAIQEDKNEENYFGMQHCMVMMRISRMSIRSPTRRIR